MESERYREWERGEMERERKKLVAEEVHNMRAENPTWIKKNMKKDKLKKGKVSGLQY
jgi:hypothetical protein